MEHARKTLTVRELPHATYDEICKRARSMGMTPEEYAYRVLEGRLTHIQKDEPSA
jgi:hypothetical protein